MDQFEIDVLKHYNQDTYFRLGSDLSVTELMNPPRITILQDRHRTNVPKTDVSSFIPALTGNGVHDQLQRYLKRENMVNPGTWYVERRMLYVHDGTRIAGRFDAMYNKEILYDIKVTSTYKYENGDFSEWENQLNIYDYMLWKDGIDLKELKIVLVSSNWQQGKSYASNYPKARLVMIPIKQWSHQTQENYISTRVTAWKSSLSLPDNKLPLCTKQERWADKAEFKLYRTPDMKRAYKSFPSQARAESYMKACQNGKTGDKWKDAIIKEESKNDWKRCHWCEVSDFCNQFKGGLEP